MQTILANSAKLLNRRGEARDLQDFLPAALEIVEKPPSPIAIGFAGTISAAAVALLLWSFFGWTDIVAIAYGKIQPFGRVKAVQAVETGKIVRIPVANGDYVSAGAPLLEMEDDEALADERALTTALHAARAESRRRERAIAAADQPARPAEIAWPEGIPEDIRRTEEAVLRADLESLSSAVEHLAAQIAAKDMEKRRLEETVSAQTRLIDVLRERVDMRQSLLPNGAGTRASLIDAMETLTYQDTILVGLRGQLREAIEAMAILRAEREKLQRAFVAENVTRWRESLRAADELEQRLAKASARLSHMVLRSPVDGVVHALAANAAGQVVTTGQEVMRVVPVNGPLEVEVYLPNKDIGFIREGQEASLKLETFPFTRYGVVKARVVSVGRDAIPEPDARQIEADPTRAGESRQIAGAQRVANLVYPVTLAAEADRIIADGREVPLMPGMAVTCEIKTSRRRLIDYLLSPLQADLTQAFRER